MEKADTKAQAKSFGVRGEVFDRLANSTAINDLTNYKGLQKNVKWKLSLYFDKIIDASRAYGKMKTELLNEYCKKDRFGENLETESGSGKFILKEELRGKYFKELERLSDEEIEFAGEKFKLAYTLVEEALSAQAISYLKPLIDFIYDEEDDK